MDSYERQPQGSRVDDDQTQTPRGEGREARGSLVYQEDRHARKDPDLTSPKPSKGPEPTSMSLPSDSTTPVSATVLSPQPQATFTSAHNQQEEAVTEDSGNRHPRQLGLGRPITRSPGQDVIEEDATPQSPPRRPAQLQPATRELTSSTQTRVSSTYGGLKDTSSSKEAGGYFDEKDRDGKDLSRRSTTLHHRVEAPLPILPRNGSDTVHDLRRATRTMDGYVVTGNPPSRQRSGIDWIVPVEEKAPLSLRPKTVEERLQPTIDIAKESRDRFARKARYTGYLLNGAIGLQVLLGSLTTGLSAVATPFTSDGSPNYDPRYVLKCIGSMRWLILS